MVPVGATPPDSVALSLMGLPAFTDGDAVVTMAGAALATTTLSLGAPHGLVAPALLASPL